MERYFYVFVVSIADGGQLCMQSLSLLLELDFPLFDASQQFLDGLFERCDLISVCFFSGLVESLELSKSQQQSFSFPLQVFYFMSQLIEFLLVSFLGSMHLLL